MCCHPEPTPASAIALTLRVVGGLITAEIATAFLVPEATMAQRISRAKQRIKQSGGSFRAPTVAGMAGLAGLELLGPLQTRLDGHYRLRAVRAQLHEWPAMTTQPCPTLEPQQPALRASRNSAI